MLFSLDLFNILSSSSPWNIIVVFALFLIGLFLIIKGGDWFVDAATWIAKVSGLPTFIIGATVVSLATTLPEIIVSILAACNGSNEMAIGNAIGSVTANTGMILGVSIFFMPVLINRKKYLPKSIILLVAILALFLFSITGTLSIVGCIVLGLIFVFFIFENVNEGKKELGNNVDENVPRDGKAIVKNIILFIVGAFFLFLGSRLLVDNGTIIAQDIFGVPERIVSLTLVAIGTSLPELVTTLTAIAKKESALSVGNIVGANIIDILLILPICALIGGGSLPVSSSTLFIDLPICFLVAVITLVPALIRGKFMRWQGILSLIVYILYIVYLCAFQTV